MPGLLADINVQGQVEILTRRLLSKDWNELWTEYGKEVFTFADVGLDRKAPDVEVWRLCQQRQLILVTGNRSRDGEDSLEATIQREGTAESLPEFTIADPERVRHSAAYAEQVVELILDFLSRLGNVRGTGRLYLP